MHFICISSSFTFMIRFVANEAVVFKLVLVSVHFVPLKQGFPLEAHVTRLAVVQVVRFVAVADDKVLDHVEPRLSGVAAEGTVVDFFLELYQAVYSVAVQCVIYQLVWREIEEKNEC